MTVGWLGRVRGGRNRNLGMSIAPLKSQRTRTPVYSRALRRVKWVVQREVHGKLRSDEELRERGIGGGKGVV